MHLLSSTTTHDGDSDGRTHTGSGHGNTGTGYGNPGAGHGNTGAGHGNPGTEHDNPVAGNILRDGHVPGIGTLQAHGATSGDEAIIFISVTHCGGGYGITLAIWKAIVNV